MQTPSSPRVKPFAMIDRDLINALSYPDLRVFLAISSFADENRKAWPGIETLSKVAGIKDRRGLIRSLRSLEKSGLLRTEPNRARNRQNLYHIGRQGGGADQGGDGDTRLGNSGAKRHSIRSITDQGTDTDRSDDFRDASFRDKCARIGLSFANFNALTNSGATIDEIRYVVERIGEKPNSLVKYVMAAITKNRKGPQRRPASTLPKPGTNDGFATTGQEVAHVDVDFAKVFSGV